MLVLPVEETRAEEEEIRTTAAAGGGGEVVGEGGPRGKGNGNPGTVAALALPAITAAPSTADTATTKILENIEVVP